MPHRRRDQRNPNPPPMQLTERDKQIIRWVHEYRILSQRQLAALLGVKKSTAAQILVRLYDHQFLDRRFLAVAEGEGGRPTFYVVDRKGADLLRGEFGLTIKWYSSSNA